MYPTDIAGETKIWFLHSKPRETILQELVHSRETKDMFLTYVARETTIWFLYSKLRETTLQELASTRENRYLKEWYMWVYPRETKDMFLTNIIIQRNNSFVSLQYSERK